MVGDVNVILVWRIAVALKAAASARLIITGVGKRFPFVLSWLICSLTRSLLLMANPWPRHEIILATSPFLLSLQFCSVAEVFYQATLRHRFGRAGSWILAVAALLGSGCSLASRLILVTPKVYGIYWTTLAERYGSLVMVVVLAVTLCLLEQFRRDLPPDQLAYRAVVLMLIYASGELLLTSLQVGTQFRYPLLTNWLPVIFDGGMSALWGTWFLAARRYAVLPIVHPGRRVLANNAERMERKEAGVRRMHRAVLEVR